MFNSSTWIESRCRYENSTRWSVYLYDQRQSDKLYFIQIWFFLSELNYWMNNLRKVLDEALIEIAKVNEEL